MRACRRVNDQGPTGPGTLHGFDAESTVAQPASRLRRAQVDVQAVTFVLLHRRGAPIAILGTRQVLYRGVGGYNRGGPVSNNPALFAQGETMVIKLFHRALPQLFLSLAVLLLGALPADAEDKFVESEGVRIRYTDEGEGPPVILIHGFTASGDLNWRIPGTVDQLSKRYRVITLDNRGHGKSDKPTEVEAYGAKMPQDALRVLDALKIEKAHFVGYSMGGMITLKLAATAPERMLSAVVGGMGWIVEGPAFPAGEGSERGNNPALRACGRSFPQLGITRDQLAAIKVPIVVVIGTDDGLLAQRVEPLSEVRPDIPIVKIAGANHVTCIFRPEFRRAIQEFLDKQPKPAAQAAVKSAAADEVEPTP